MLRQTSHTWVYEECGGLLPVLSLLQLFFLPIPSLAPFPIYSFTVPPFPPVSINYVTVSLPNTVCFQQRNQRILTEFFSWMEHRVRLFSLLVFFIPLVQFFELFNCKPVWLYALFSRPFCRSLIQYCALPSAHVEVQHCRSKWWNDHYTVL